MPIHGCKQAYIVYSHYIRPKLTCVCVYVRVHVCVLVLDYNVGLIKYSSTYARMHYACMYVFLLRASMAARTSIYTRAFMYVWFDIQTDKHADQELASIHNGIIMEQYNGCILSLQCTRLQLLTAGPSRCSECWIAEKTRSCCSLPKSRAILQFNESPFSKHVWQCMDTKVASMRCLVHATYAGASSIV